MTDSDLLFAQAKLNPDCETTLGVWADCIQDDQPDKAALVAGAE